MSLPGAARALGLGDIRVDSALDERLSAQIDIVGATRDELAALTAKVANRDVFQHYNADRPSFLASATFKVGLDSAGRPVLNVRSSEPFTDPVVSLLVDLRWGNGELIREYPLLLDPPGFPMSSRAPTSAAVTADRPASAEVAPRTANTMEANLPAVTQETPALARPAQAAAEAAPTERSAEAAPTGRASQAGSTDTNVAVHQGGASTTQHTVARRETLRAIVRRAGAAGEGHAQRMMIAIFRANPHAFDGNINLMHRGAVLTMPTDDEVKTISAGDARREVRAQMAAWRLNGRAAGSRRLAASPAQPPAAAAASQMTPPSESVSATAPSTGAAHSAAAAPAAVDASSNESLKGRVRSLEQALDDLHQQLARENAALENLKTQAERTVASTAATGNHTATQPAPAQVELSPQPAPGSAQAMPQPVAAAEHTSTPPSQSAPQAGSEPVQAGAAGPAEPDHPAAATVGAGEHTPPRVEVMAAEPRHEAAPSSPQSAAKSSAGKLLGTVAAMMAPAVALVWGGFVFFRRRALQALEPSRVPPAMEAPESHALVAASAAAAPAKEAEGAQSRWTEPSKPATATNFVTPPLVRSAPTVRETPNAPTDQTTQELEIDTELLERSYLDAMAIDTLGIDNLDTEATLAATHIPIQGSAKGAASAPGAQATRAEFADTVIHVAAGAEPAHDATATGLETVALDASELDTEIVKADLHTAILDAKKIDAALGAAAPAPAAAGKTGLDHRLPDPDATAEHTHAHHVQMPSALHEHAVVSERRTNIIDVLKAAIERDPQRRDLQMKLLETYYSAAAMNRRAFLDVVSKLSDARDLLTAEDWQHVVKMGEEIAPNDGLAPESDKDDAAAA